MGHNGRMANNELDNLKLEGVSHLLYFPDLSLSDFFLFGMSKPPIKDRVFHAIEEIITAVHKVSDELTLEDLQSVFFN
jgi:hypothetical protein